MPVLAGGPRPQREVQPLDPRAEADARRGRPAELLHEAVVASAAQRVLCDPPSGPTNSQVVRV